MVAESDNWAGGKRLGDKESHSYSSAHHDIAALLLLGANRPGTGSGLTCIGVMSWAGSR